MCHIIEVDQTKSSTLVEKKNPKDWKRKIVAVKGTVLSIISRPHSMKTENKSHARKPASPVCLEHDASAKLWVKTDQGDILKLDYEGMTSPVIDGRTRKREKKRVVILETDSSN